MRNLQVCFISILLVLSASCSPAWGNQPGSATTSTSTVESQGITPTDTITTTPTPSIKSIWIAPAVPEQLVEEAGKFGFARVDIPDGADIQLTIAPEETSGATTWIYALVAPFPTIVDDVSFETIQSSWNGSGGDLFVGVPLRMSAATLAAFSALWGSPNTGSVLVQEKDQLLPSAWEAGTAWAIIPFEELNPQWKVLTVDGNSPIHNDFVASEYPLQVTFGLTPSMFGLPVTNRDASKLTTVIMTGVTALVRATAVRMETKGITYPGEEVRDTFRAADLLHISNEIPFYAECPSPIPLMESLRFCSDPKYIELLEDIGTDIVELTGNHFQDQGSEATLYTLDMYDARGWLYYGGGRNQLEAQKPILLTHNGNKLAFIGCNTAGPDFAWAGDDTPGAAQCNFDYMYGEIARLRSEGYLPIVTFQHFESYHLYPVVEQVGDFHNMAMAGAAIVSGSQSHFPQFMVFDGETYLHYGLGNLFFDQMDYPAVGTRREFVDRHVFYDGQFISTELLTFMLEDFARPRVMEDWEREQLLLDVFRENGWMPLFDGEY